MIPIKHALLASSYTHPRRHFVWSLVAEACFGAASKNEVLRSVWTLIDSALFGSHVDNRKYLAFSLLAHTLVYNFRARVAQLYSLLLACVMITYASEVALSRVTSAESATRWLWTYNNERPNMAIGGITPKQKLAMAA